MTCHELLSAISDYVDGTIDPVLCDQFSEHLAGCDPCQIVVDNIRRTIRLYKDGRPYELPPEFCQQMRAVLHRRWKEIHIAASAG